MNNSARKDLLERLITNSKEIKNEISSDPVFKSWKNLVERTLIKIYSEDSHEYKSFKELKFYYSPRMWYAGDDFTQEHLEVFRNSFKTSINIIESLIEEINHDTITTLDDNSSFETIKGTEKVFISHSKKDAEFVEELIELLELFGITNNQIFCTSVDGYGIPLGDNFLDRIKNELNQDTLVLFILTDNFFDSPVCLCEMGATWILTKTHIPIIIPPFSFNKIKGVIPLTQGMEINDKSKMNLLKEKLTEELKLTQPLHQSWERKRDKIIERINNKIIANKNSIETIKTK